MPEMTAEMTAEMKLLIQELADTSHYFPTEAGERAYLTPDEVREEEASRAKKERAAFDYNETITGLRARVFARHEREQATKQEG